MLNVNGDSGNEFYGNFIREKKGDCREKVLQLLKICWTPVCFIHIYSHTEQIFSECPLRVISVLGFGDTAGNKTNSKSSAILESLENHTKERLQNNLCLTTRGILYS